MPPEVPTRPQRDSGVRLTPGVILGIGLLLLLIHIVGFTLHTDRAARAFDACAVPANTIAGMPEPRFFIDNDAYAWMAHTRDLMASGFWRIRYTFMDNAPQGREMHWSHPLIWTLRGMATVIMAVEHWPAARAVELAGVWAMPFLQFLCLGLAFVVLSRKLGWVPAGLFCFLFLSLNGLSDAFNPLKPDHHGLQLCTSLFAFACLQFGGMGWTNLQIPPKPASRFRAFLPLALPGPEEARRWFIASGVFGGLALWLGATVWLVALAAIALSSLVAMPALFHPTQPGVKYHPELWRIWAFAGTAVAAGAYLLEYAPSHFAMRLEVNHPLYWLCWLGVAECLLFAGKSASIRFWKHKHPADWTFAILGLLVALALPMAVLWGPANWHHLRDPLLQRLHAGFIDEFQPAWTLIQNRPVGFLFEQMGLLPILAILSAGALLRFYKPQDARDVTVRSALVVAILFLLLMLLQMRWGFFAVGALVWLGILSLSVWSGPDLTTRKWIYPAAAALLLNGIAADALRWRSENAASIAREVPSSWIQSSLAKRKVLQWGLAAGTNQWRMVGLATEAPMLYYFTGIRTVASYYWENAEGWHAEAAFFADTPTGEMAHEIARKRGLTHAFALPSEAFPRLYTTIQAGRNNPVALRPTLAGQLAFPTDATLPAWISLDTNLSAISSKLYAFKTPEGLIGEVTTGQVFLLHSSVPLPAP